jgi:ABC-type transporter Mla subunit MlaD
MKRFFDLFNLTGIGILAWLCAGQWTANANLGRQNDHLETIRLQQAATLQTQTDTIKEQVQDLDEFRTRLASAEGQLKDLAKQLSKTTAERDEAAGERDRLKVNLPQWIAAVKQRDELIARAGGEIQMLAKQRNDAVGQFNDLASKYNAIMKAKQGGQ